MHRQGKHTYLNCMVTMGMTWQGWVHIHCPKSTNQEDENMWIQKVTEDTPKWQNMQERSIRSPPPYPHPKALTVWKCQIKFSLHVKCEP
jgi:hypothetical protein